MEENQRQEANDPNTPPIRLRQVTQESESLTHLVAQNPNASPSLLDTLAVHKNPEVVEAVVQNPSIAQKTFLELAKKYPERFLENPVLPLFLLEDPSFLKALPSVVVKALFRSDKAPLWLLEALRESYEYGTLADVVCPWVSEGLSENASMVLCVSRYAKIRDYLASNKYASSFALEKLASDSEPEVRRSVASNPKTPPHVLEVLASDSEPEVRCSVASNKYASSFALEKLASDSDPKVRCGVASNPQSPLHVLEALSQDAEQFVIDGVFSHPTAPLSLLESIFERGSLTGHVKLFNRPDLTLSLLKMCRYEGLAGCREGLARKTTNEELLWLLVEDTDPSVRGCLADNPKLPAGFLEILAKDEDLRVRVNVARRAPRELPVLIKILAEDKAWIVRKAVAENENISNEALFWLTWDEEAPVRSAVCRHPRTRTLCLEVLSHDKEWCIRKAVAEHPNTSRAIKDALLLDKDWRVREKSFMKKVKG